MVPAIPLVFGFDFDHIYFMDSRLKQFGTKYNIPICYVFVTVIVAMAHVWTDNHSDFQFKCQFKFIFKLNLVF